MRMMRHEKFVAEQQQNQCRVHKYTQHLHSDAHGVYALNEKYGILQPDIIFYKKRSTYYKAGNIYDRN